MPLVLALFCDFDWYPVLTGYLGLVLLGALFLSVGMLASALTENQIVAAFVSIGLLLVFWLLAGVGSLLGDTAIGQAVSYLSFMEHYDHLVRGLVDTKDLVYFVQQSGLDALFGSPSRGFGTVEINLKTIPLGVVGMALAAAGAVGYSLAPEKLWLVALLEGSALLCLIIFCCRPFQWAENLLRSSLYACRGQQPADDPSFRRHSRNRQFSGCPPLYSLGSVGEPKLLPRPANTSRVAESSA